MALKKNISSGNKDTQLLTIFTSHFGGFLNLARIRLVCLFIEALCKVQTVNLSKLACGFSNKSSYASNYRRIQRFFQQVKLPMEFISKLIFSMLPDKKSLVLLMDRTNWKFGNSDINILMLGVAYKGIAIPLMFKMLPKKGNSNTDERIALMEQFFEWFGKDCIDSLLADREFIGREWIAFLNEHKIKYHIRIRNNFYIHCLDTGKKLKASRWFENLKIGESRHFLKRVKVKGVYCYLSGSKIITDGKLDYCIIISFEKPTESLEKYKQRWQIETLFKGLKSSGFNLEETHMVAIEKLEKLILLVMIAYVWCYKVGDYIDSKIKAIRIKTHGRRAVSIFKNGLNYIAETLISNYNKLDFNILKFLSCT